jgi:apolipoprotein N-acyltransferase
MMALPIAVCAGLVATAITTIPLAVWVFKRRTGDDSEAIGVGVLVGLVVFGCVLAWRL